MLHEGRDLVPARLLARDPAASVVVVVGEHVPSERISCGTVRHKGPGRRMSRDDREPFRFGDDAAKGVRAPQALALVRRVEQDRPDLAPRSIQDLLPLLKCPSEGPVQRPPALEVTGSRNRQHRFRWETTRALGAAIRTTCAPATGTTLAENDRPRAFPNRRPEVHNYPLGVASTPVFEKDLLRADGDGPGRSTHTDQVPFAKYARFYAAINKGIPGRAARCRVHARGVKQRRPSLGRSARSCSRTPRVAYGPAAAQLGVMEPPARSWTQPNRLVFCLQVQILMEPRPRRW